MVPLPICVLLIALLMSAVQRRVAARYDQRPVPVEHAETIFVCLVGTDVAVLRSIAAEAQGRAKRPHAVSFGIVVVVTSSEQVREDETDTLSLREDQNCTVAWRYAKDPKTHLVRAQRHAMRKLYRNEDYILFLHGARCADDWDETCSDLVGDGRYVLSCKPTKDDVPTFPTIVDGRIIAKPATTSRVATTRSTTHVHDFAFARREVWSQVGIRDGQLEMTHRMRAKGIEPLTSLCRLCYCTHKCGVGAAASTSDVSITSFGDAPRVGIVNVRDDEELIDKYGSVDVARVVISQDADLDG